MIKINLLSKNTFEDLQRAFKSETPVKDFEVMGYEDSVDVYIISEALLMYTRNDVTLYYKGRLFKMNATDFLTIEIE